MSTHSPKLIEHAKDQIPVNVVAAAAAATTATVAVAVVTPARPLRSSAATATANSSEICKVNRKKQMS